MTPTPEEVEALAEVLYPRLASECEDMNAWPGMSVARAIAEDILAEGYSRAPVEGRVREHVFCPWHGIRLDFNAKTFSCPKCFQSDTNAPEPVDPDEPVGVLAGVFYARTALALGNPGEADDILAAVQEGAWDDHNITLRPVGAAGGEGTDGD